MARSFVKSCSILGTLIALAIATPVAAAPDEEPQRSAQKKKKKAAAEEPEEPKSVDALMDDATEADKKRAEEKKKAGGDDPEAGDTAGEEKEEEFVEPDAWERPPVEEEKAPEKVVAPPPEEVVGDGKPISAGLVLGYGFKTDRATGGLGTDPYGFGLGVRGGYTLDFGLHVGVYFMYYLGSSKTGNYGGVTGSGEVSANYMQFGAEAGYDLWIASIIFRPSLQIGLGVASADTPLGSASTTDLMFAPGASVLYPMDGWYIGGDLRANIVTGDGISGVLLAAVGGLRF